MCQNRGCWTHSPGSKWSGQRGGSSVSAMNHRLIRVDGCGWAFDNQQPWECELVRKPESELEYLFLHCVRACLIMLQVSRVNTPRV